ncbi:hypothetical protein ACJA27_03310 [Mycoplasmopsis lipophila]|uniref:hypothetical protein n=1 Tax=Mycoplasmopsis lipophila TaxID=2117 RepID=UPI00387352BF
MIKKELFKKQEKDLTVSTHYTIRKSLVEKIINDSKEYNLSASKIVDTIIANYYENIKK